MMASVLENYVSKVQILATAGNSRELAELHQTETIELLAKNWNMLDNVLETLDMHEHTLPCVYVLMAKLSSVSLSNADPPRIVALFKQFMHALNVQQARFVASSFYEMCHMFSNYVVEQPAVCIQGISVVSEAIAKIQTSPSQLTPIHADLLMLILKAKCLKVAKRYLDVDITAIATTTELRGHATPDPNNDSKYFLLYYYYGGMIWASLRDYHEALYYFEVCISMSAMALSHIMLQAYKKFTLISLILYGKIKPIPKYSWQVISRFMKPLSVIYHELATAYGTSSSEELNLVITKYTETFTRDHNMGLVKQVAKSLVKKNINRLTKTFMTLSLADVAARVQLRNSDEAEKCILDMIKSHEIYATINQRAGMVVFNENPQRYNTPQMFAKIEKETNRTMGLVKMINDMEEEILLNPTYIKKGFAPGNEDVQNSKSYACEAD